MSKQTDYVIEVLEREISGYSEQFAPERIILLKDYVNNLKSELPKLTEYQLAEIQKCREDIVYFAEKYVIINDIFSSGIPFIPHPYQVKLLRFLQNNNYAICKMQRQSGKTLCGLVAVLHELLFGEQRAIGINSFKVEASRSIFDKLKLYYSYLPHWMAAKIVCNNNERFQLVNGSSVEIITPGSSFTGKTFDTILLDEYAFLFGKNALILDDNEQQELLEKIDLKKLKEYKDFWSVLLPIINRCKNSRILILSTIASNNKKHYFNKLWLDSVRGKNKFIAFESNWMDSPELDENWKDTAIQRIGEKAFSLEYECAIDTESP